MTAEIEGHRLIDTPRMDDFRDVSCTCGARGGVMKLLTSVKEWFDEHIEFVQMDAAAHASPYPSCPICGSATVRGGPGELWLASCGAWLDDGGSIKDGDCENEQPETGTTPDCPGGLTDGCLCCSRVADAVAAERTRIIALAQVAEEQGIKLTAGWLAAAAHVVIEEGPLTIRVGGDEHNTRIVWERDVRVLPSRPDDG